MRTQGQGNDVGDSGRDMVAIRGSREDVVYPGHGRRPGRIGSALSLPYSDASTYNLNEDYLHHDDIVEHLDVIGM